MSFKASSLLSRHVFVDGKDNGLCVVHLDDHGNPVTEPFHEETPSTVYTDSPVYVDLKAKTVVVQGKDAFKD